MNRVTNHSLSPLIFHIPPNFVRIKQRGVTSFPADAFQIHARGRGEGEWNRATLKKGRKKKIYIYSRSVLTVHRIQQNCRHRSSVQTCARIHPPRPRSGWKINRSNISIREGWILGDFWLDRLDKGRANQFRIVSPKLIEIESITGGRGGWIELFWSSFCVRSGRGSRTRGVALNMSGGTERWSSLVWNELGWSGWGGEEGENCCNLFNAEVEWPVARWRARNWTLSGHNNY